MILELGHISFYKIGLPMSWAEVGFTAKKAEESRNKEQDIDLSFQTYFPNKVREKGTSLLCELKLAIWGFGYFLYPDFLEGKVNNLSSSFVIRNFSESDFILVCSIRT